MDKYLLMRLLLNVFELLAAVTAMLQWKKIKHSYWKWFAIYLVIIAATEIFAEYVGYYLKNEQLNAAINIYFSIPLQFIFFFWLFYKWFQNNDKKKWPIAGIVVYLLSILVEVLLFKEQQLWFFSFSYVTGNIILLLLTLMFFFGFIRSQQVLHYRSSRMFWISIGLLVFYLGSLPLYGVWNTLAKNYPTVFNTYWMVVINLNYLMYLSFAISFIWGNQK